MARCTFPVAALALSVLAPLGCGLFGGSGGTPRESTPIDVQVQAGERINPDELGRALPTVVRLYQLRSAAALERAEPHRLYRQPKEALGEDLLQVDELTISPSETVRRRIARNPEARHLAAVALLRRPPAATWRAIVALSRPDRGAAFQFLLDEHGIELR